MKYELLKDSKLGVIIDPTPVFQDIRGTMKVSFILPVNGAYIALFRDEAGHEFKAVIHNGEVNVPSALLKKEQQVGLTVCLTDGEEILHEWECHPLRVSSFLRMRQFIWQLTAGLTDDALYNRIAELEKAHAAVQAEFAELKTKYAALLEANVAKTSAYTEEYKAVSQKSANFQIKLYDLDERLSRVEIAAQRIFEALEQ